MKIILHIKFMIFYFVLLLFAQCMNPSKNSRISSSQEWKVIGPGGGGGVMKPTISPLNENFVLAHCDMTGAYVTTNGGETWKMKNLWNVPEDFEFDPSDPNTVYLATRGFLHSEDRGSGISLLLRSEDKGESWRIIYPDVARSKKVERMQSTSLKPSEIIDGALDATIRKVKVDPSDNNRIYLGLTPLTGFMGPATDGGARETSSLILSDDRGASWKVISSLPDRQVLAIFPEDGLVTVFTEKSCLRINERTGETINLPLPVESIIVADMGKGESGSLIYLQSNFIKEGEAIRGGMYVSSDMGETWSRRNNGLLDDSADARLPAFRNGLAVCASAPEVAYISVTRYELNETGRGEAIYSIYKTTDSGMSWKPVFQGSSRRGYFTGNFAGSWMEASFGPGWGGSPINLGVSPGNPDICYATDNGRAYKTSDGGVNWVQVYSNNNPDGSYSTNGLNVTTCYNVHFDPFDKNHFFLSYTDIGLFHTFNSGESWFHAVNNIPGEWQNTCYDLTFDPDVRGKVWSVWANAHDLPRTKMFGPRGFDHYRGGVAASEDGGLSWNKSNSGIPENAICTGILLDDSSPVEARKLYVSVFDKGIFKSFDGGENWKEVNNGFGENLFTWQVRKNSHGRIFALFARGLRDGQTVDGEVYYSDDEAENWKKLQLPEGVNAPHDLLTHPSDPGIMYISCWPRNLNGQDSHGGVIRTVDGGETWDQIFDERVRVNSAAFDPLKHDIIYINTFQNAAYRSADAGDSWDRIQGYRFKWGQRAIPDIHNPGMLFLTTFGGSLFYGPSEGNPGVADDIVNMPEGWW